MIHVIQYYIIQTREGNYIKKKEKNRNVLSELLSVIKEGMWIRMDPHAFGSVEYGSVIRMRIRIQGYKLKEKSRV